MNINAHDLKKRIGRLKLLLLDVDGVLTRGDIIYDDSGREIKVFNVKDGLGIRLLLKAGIKVAIVTGRRSEALAHRCRNLGLDQLYDGVGDKAALLDQIALKNDVRPREVGFVGDDLPDLALMKKVGLSFAVGDAHETVAARADVVTSAKGGQGAVREVAELILKNKGLWENIIQQFE